MAIKRDYGSFSKACQRFFGPMIAPLGMSSFGGATFGRRHEHWIDGLFLQQSQWGSGKFSVTVGFNVPGLGALWQSPPNFGFLLGGRLYQDGVGADCWLPAANKVELTAGFETFANYLQNSMGWFDRAKSIDDIAFLYKQELSLGDIPASLTLGSHLSAANFGFLLLLAGRTGEAKSWLSAAYESMSRPLYFTRDRKFVHEARDGARAVKRTESSERQLSALQTALQKL